MRGISGGGRGAAPWGRDTWMRFDGRCGGGVPTGERIKSRRGAGPRRASGSGSGPVPRACARDEGRGGAASECWAVASGVGGVVTLKVTVASDR